MTRAHTSFQVTLAADRKRAIPPAPGLSAEMRHSFAVIESCLRMLRQSVESGAPIFEAGELDAMKEERPARQRRPRVLA